MRRIQELLEKCMNEESLKTPEKRAGFRNAAEVREAVIQMQIKMIKDNNLEKN